MVRPYCSRHCQTRSTNASRPISSRLVPSATSCFSTCTCVAMPAWSVPKIHFVRRPFIRCTRTIASWIEPFSAWPMWSAPVTLGGGIAIEKFSAASPVGSGWKSPESRQRCTMRGSTSEGSKRLRSFRLDMGGSQCMDDDPWIDPRPEPREWDATVYHRVAAPHQGWGAEVLDRLELAGDETVLDLGVGTGRVAAQLLERLPRGRVIGVDGSAAMVEQARALLDPARATLLHQDLLQLGDGQPAGGAAAA